MQKQSAGAGYQFETELDGDRITLPGEMAAELARATVKKISVRILTKQISDRLHSLNVSESEIDRIGALQLEPRENVLSFLASQGKLAGSRFAKRFPAS